MDNLICHYCEKKNCMIRKAECLRHIAIEHMLIEAIIVELPQLHRYYTEAEEEMEEDD